MANSHNLQPALDASQNQLSLTLSASDSLDTKALAILGFDAAFAIFTLQSESGKPLWLLLPLFAALLVSAYLTILIIRPDEYRGAVTDINKMQTKYLNLDEQALILQLLSNTMDAITFNNQKNSLKSRHCGRAIVLSLIGIGFLIGCIL